MQETQRGGRSRHAGASGRWDERDSEAWGCLDGKPSWRPKCMGGDTGKPVLLPVGDEPQRVKSQGSNGSRHG